MICDKLDQALANGLDHLDPADIAALHQCAAEAIRDRAQAVLAACEIRMKLGTSPAVVGRAVVAARDVRAIGPHLGTITSFARDADPARLRSPTSAELLRWARKTLAMLDDLAAEMPTRSRHVEPA